MNSLEKIDLLIRSICPLFYVGGPDTRFLLQRCMDLGQRNGLEVFIFNLCEGMRVPGKTSSKDRILDPLSFADLILKKNNEMASAKKRTLFIFEHVDPLLENQDPMFITRLRLKNDRSRNRYSVILLGSGRIDMPEMLRDIPVVQYAGLEMGPITELLLEANQALSEKEATELAFSLRGLSLSECENIVALSLAKYGDIERRFIKTQRAKAVSGRTGGLLQIVEPSGDLTDVGGLKLLKDWLIKRKSYFDGAPLPNTDYGICPRGIILTGPPGCGKSFVAEAIAGTWNTTLVKINNSALFSSLVGATEKRIKEALDTAQALSPCVLWIDELEKLFPRPGGAESDGGVLFRAVGVFLEFLQSKREGVFVCATSNSIFQLPPELMRPGRFDAVFFIDLPQPEERKEILEILLEKYGISEAVEITWPLIEATEGFSCAELEQAVLELLYEIQDAPNGFSELSFLRIIKGIIPLAFTMGDEIQRIRAFSKVRLRPASGCNNPSGKKEALLCRTLRK